MFEEPFRLDDFLKPDSRFSMDEPVVFKKGELGGMLELRLLPQVEMQRDLADLERELRVSVRKGELGGLLEVRLKPWRGKAADGTRHDQESGFAMTGN